MSKNENFFKKYILFFNISSFLVLLTITLLVGTLIDYVVFYSYSLSYGSISIYLIVFTIFFAFYFLFLKKRAKSLLETINSDVFEKMSKATTEFLNQHRTMEMFTQNLVAMVDNNEGISMWLKDENDRYIYANKQLRSLLFNDKEMFQVVGRTDGELFGRACDYKDFERYIKEIPPEKYPKIKSSDFFKEGSICNTTDIITRVLKVPCRFYEEVGDLCLDVFKTPLLNNKSEIVGTVGTLFDITPDKERRKSELIYLENNGKAFRINATNNYYIKQYGFGDFI